jgi:hypothetical protein
MWGEGEGGRHVLNTGKGYVKVLFQKEPDGEKLSETHVL